MSVVKTLRDGPGATPLRPRGWVVVCLILASFGLTEVTGAATIDQQVQDQVEAAVEGGLEPTDFNHLFMAFYWRRTLEDFSVAGRAVDRLAAARPMDPLMSDEVRRIRAELAVEAGLPAAARELFVGSGGLSGWWAHGPENIEELEDFAVRAKLPPSSASWRSVPGTDPLGWVRVGGLAWPARRQMMFLAAAIHSDREQPVALHLGASQVARAWLNGREVLTTAQPLRHAEDQYVAGGWLGEGANRLVVAVASESDDWWLRVRLTAPDGSRLTGVQQVEGPPVETQPVARDRPDVRSLEDELRRAVARGRDGAALALAAFLVDRHPQPEGGDARSVCRAARKDSEGTARLLEWMLPADPGTRRELLEGALEADSDLHWARIELATWYQERGLFQQAADILQPARGVTAVGAAALEQEAELWGQLTLPGLAGLSAAHPRCVTAAAALGDVAIRLSRWLEARQAVDRLAGLAPGSPEAQALSEQLAEDCGDSARIRELLSEILHQDPNRPDLRVRVSRLVAADAGQDAGRGVLEDGLARCPDQVELLLELARLELDGGDPRRAAALARRVLELRPQDRRSQRLLGFLGEEAEDLGWLRSSDELWVLADEAPPGTPAVLVLDRVEVRFLPSQLTETLAQQVFLITDADRAEDLLTHTLAHVPERQRLRVLEARILSRDGTQINARQSDTPRLAEPEINLFYDARLRVLRFPALQDGDLIELAWVLSETAESNDTGPYKGGVLEIGQPIPVGLTELELSGPRELLPAWELVLIDGEPEQVEDEDGVVHVRWRWRDLAGYPLGSPPAPRRLTVPYLAYSNHPEWGDLATWYERHTASRVRSSRQVAETADSLIAGVEDRLDRIARIYRFVTNDIRYVGLEFGEHRYRPFSADWVLNHKIGDCKDKAALMVALFEAIDIPARMVMVRTSEQGTAASDLALLELFNHAIAYLPEDDLWLDGTAAGHAPFPPPAMCQGALVLVVDGEDSAPEITPIPGAGFARSVYRFANGEDGFIDLELETEDTGEAADIRRLGFAGSQDPRRVTRWLQDRFPGAELVGEPRLRMIPGRDPAVLELEARIPRSALLGTGGITTFPGNTDWISQLAPTGVRSGPLLLPVRPILEWTVEVDLGRPPRQLPEALAMESPYGELELVVEGTGAGYRMIGSFRVNPGLVPAEESEAARRFLVEAERHLQKPMEVP